MENGIGAKIKSRREEVGITPLALARLAGVHYQTVSRIEAGNHKPSVRILEKLAAALNVPVGFFFL